MELGFAIPGLQLTAPVSVLCPKLEILLNETGFYHFDQIAKWSDQECAWADQNLEGYKGRASRDKWIEQAIALLGEG